MLAKQTASIPLASGTQNTIVVAGSDSTAAQKSGAQYVATGTNDDLVANQALNAAAALHPNGGYIVQFLGTFNFSQMARVIGSNITLDWWDATFSIPSGWAASGRAAWQLGTNHQTILGVPSGIPGAVTFTNASSGAGFFAGDSGYLLQGLGTYPTGLNNSTKYFVVNYTPTGLGGATSQLSLTAGGTAVTASNINGATGLTFVLYAYVGTTDSANNVITMTDSSLTTIPNGTCVMIDANTDATIPAWRPFYLKNAVSSPNAWSYQLYNDPQLLNRFAITSNGAVHGIQPASIALTTLGGKFLVSSNAVFSVGVIKDNLTCVGSRIIGPTFDWTSASSPAAGAISLYLGGYGSMTDVLRSFGGGQSITSNNAQQLIRAAVISGGKGTGITGTGSATFSNQLKIQGCNISNFAAWGIRFLGSTNCYVSDCSFFNNCTTSQSPNLHINDSGVGNIYDTSNQFDNTSGNAVGNPNRGVIRTYNLQAQQNSGVTVGTYTPLLTGIFRVSGWLDIVEATTETLKVQVVYTYTDSDGVVNTNTVTLSAMNSVGTFSTTIGPTGGNYLLVSPTFQNIANQPITAATLTATATNAVYDVQINLEQLG